MLCLEHLTACAEKLHPGKLVVHGCIKAMIAITHFQMLAGLGFKCIIHQKRQRDSKKLHDSLQTTDRGWHFFSIFLTSICTNPYWRLHTTLLHLFLLYHSLMKPQVAQQCDSSPACIKALAASHLARGQHLQTPTLALSTYAAMKIKGMVQKHVKFTLHSCIRW